MKPSFWLQSWKEGGMKTSFHRQDVHPYVKFYAPDYFLRGQRVLVPLCGKDNALMWYKERAEHVIGVDLSMNAIEQFFQENNLNYSQTGHGRYEADGITLFNRNIFDLTSADLGRIDFVYDRAALVALPDELRQRYRKKIDDLMHPGSKCLLVTLEFQPYLGDTPPFSITPADVHRYYGDAYIVDHVKNVSLPNHRMVEKFNLDFLKEHGFILTKTAKKQLNELLYFWPLGALKSS
ncbi:MAG: thiopurine S-methyltransferase [Cyanobacteria bacterium J06634_5]